MAKRMSKKVKQNIELTQQQNTSTTTLGYQGKVKVSIQNGNKTIKTFEGHNEGKLPLFKFICKCLGGNFEASIRPNRIVLFKNTAGTDDFFKVDNIISSAIATNATAIINSSDNEATVTYHFRIPYIWIKEKVVAGVGLFTDDFVTDDSINLFDKCLCATYIFVNEDKEKEPLDLTEESSSGNYSLVLDWELKILNSKE